MAQLTIRTKNEDGDAVTHTLHLEDEHADDEAAAVEQLAARAERAADLRSELNAVQHDLATAKEAIVSDIVRRKKLAGEYDGDDGLDQEADREYLEGLPVDRLKMEYKRAPSDAELDTSSATGNETPDDRNAGQLSSRYVDAGL